MTSTSHTDWQAPPSWQRVEPLPMLDPDGVPLYRLDDGWTPGLLVLAWPEQFVGAEEADRKQVELAVVTLADAALVDLYLAPVWGSSRRGLRIVPRAARADGVDLADLGGDSSEVPWVWQSVLAAARAARPGSYGERLFHWRGQTLRAAQARGLVRPERRDRFLARAAGLDPEVASTSKADAERLARWWAQFVAVHPELHEALVRATAIHDAVA